MLCCVSKQLGSESAPADLSEDCRTRGQRPGSLIDTFRRKNSGDEDVPPILLPCAICSRTFKPQSLEKHTKICERSAAKKRKPFDSAKQRIQGTDLAEFLPKQTKRRPFHEEKSSKPKTSWKQTHDEFLRAIRAARGEVDDLPPIRHAASSAPTAAPTRANEKGTCPTCNRQFGIKAYERHVAWCKERANRLPVSPATNIAKERLEARINYRAPALKNRRLTNREKYSPGSAINVSSAAKMLSPGPKPKESASVPSCVKGNDSSLKPKPAVVRRPAHNREPSSIPGPMKSRLADRTNRPAEEFESGPTSTRTSSSNPRYSLPSNATPKHNKYNTKTTSPPPKSVRKSDVQSNLSPHFSKTQEPTNSEAVNTRSNLPSVRGYNNPKLNDVTVNQDVIGMSVQPCNIHSEQIMTSWKQITDEKSTSGLASSVIKSETEQTVLSVFLQDIEKLGVTGSENVDGDKHKVDVAVEEPADRHRQRLLASQKIVEAPRSPELVKLPNTPKLSWAENIKKLDKTYLIAESRNSNLESAEPSIPSRKRQIVKNSPRVEFCTKDARISTGLKPAAICCNSPGNLDYCESQTQFSVHVKFTSTPLPDVPGADCVLDVASGAPDLETIEDTDLLADFDCSLEGGTGWSGGLKVQEPLTLELGFLESLEEDSAPRDTLPISSTSTATLRRSLETARVTAKQQSPRISSPGTGRKKKKKPIVKLTPRLKPLDQTMPIVEQPLNYSDFEKNYGSPMNPLTTGKPIYSAVDGPVLRSPKINRSPARHAKRRSSTDVCRSQRGLQDSSIDLNLPESQSPRECVSLVSTSVRVDTRATPGPLKSAKKFEDLRNSVEDDGTTSLAQELNGVSRKSDTSAYYMCKLTGRRRKFGVKKRTKQVHSSNTDLEDSIPGPSTIEIGGSSTFAHKLPNLKNSSDNVQASVRSNHFDRRRCGTYVIEKGSVTDFSARRNLVSDEPLEDKPSKKRRRRTESTCQSSRTDTDRRGNDSIIAGCDLEEGNYSPNDSLAASRNFLESTIEDEVTVNDEMGKIYDKYLNHNFDYDSENTIGGSCSHEIEFSNDPASTNARDIDVLVDPEDELSSNEIARFSSGPAVISCEGTRRPEMEVSRSSHQGVFDVQRRIRRSMDLLRGSTDSLVSMMDTGSRSIQLATSSGCYDTEICTIQPIVSDSGTVVKVQEGSLNFLPKINLSEPHMGEERKSKIYWEKVAQGPQSRRISLDPPKESCRLLKRNPKTQFLPPMVPGNSFSMVERQSGASQDYDPFLAAERQMNELFADTSDQLLTEGTQLSSDHSPSSDTKPTQFPLSHSSAFVKYPSSPRPNKRASVIAPPSEFDDFTSDFSSDSIETNSTHQEFFINNLNTQTREVTNFDKLTDDCNRRVVIDKSKTTSGGDVNANSARGKTFVSSVERSRKILEKVSPKVVRPAVNRSHSVRSVRATSAPRAPERKSSLKKLASPDSEYSGVSNTRNNNNNYRALSGSNLSLSSLLSSEADIKRSNSVFDELLSSFEDDGSSFPSLKSFLKSDSVSTSMSSQVPDSRIRNGMISDEELSSPDSYKRQNHSKLSADSAYSSLNRKCSNHGRSTTDVGSRIEQDLSLKHRDAEIAPGKLKMSRFCHECGSRFPEPAKFCCECGVKRLVL